MEILLSWGRCSRFWLCGWRLPSLGYISLRSYPAHSAFAGLGYLSVWNLGSRGFLFDPHTLFSCENSTLAAWKGDGISVHWTHTQSLQPAWSEQLPLRPSAAALHRCCSTWCLTLTQAFTAASVTKHFALSSGANSPEISRAAPAMFSAVWLKGKAKLPKGWWRARLHKQHDWWLRDTHPCWWKCTSAGRLALSTFCRATLAFSFSSTWL